MQSILQSFPHVLGCVGLQNTSVIQRHLFLASHMIFSNLRSLCITPLAWQYATPDQNASHRGGILVAKDWCFCPKSSEFYKNPVHTWDKIHWIIVDFSDLQPLKKWFQSSSIASFNFSKTFTSLRKLVGRPQPPTLRAIASVLHRTFPRLPTNRHLSRSTLKACRLDFHCVKGGTVGAVRGSRFIRKPTKKNT